MMLEILSHPVSAGATKLNLRLLSSAFITTSKNNSNCKNYPPCQTLKNSLITF